jgi:phosphatidylserine decarboxylase
MRHSPLALLFRVRSYEKATKLQLTVLDWDKLTSNDYIADASSDVKELLDSTVRRRGCMRLARMGPMKVSKVPMSTAKEMLWEAKHNFVVTFWWVAFMSVSVCPFAN